jgi:hypothetical protein
LHRLDIFSLVIASSRTKSWLYATKPISKGEEFFWNYGDNDMWKHIHKLNLKDCIEKMMLFRDNKAENERVIKLLKYDQLFPNKL